MSNDPFATSRPSLSSSLSEDAERMRSSAKPIMRPEGASTPSEMPAPAFHRPKMSEDEEASAEKSACIIVVVIFIVLALAGAGVWYYLKHRGPAENKTPPPPPPPSPQSSGTTTVKDYNLISASDGGEVSYTDPQGNTAQVIIPPFALTKDAKIEIEWVSAGTVTDLYHLKPDGLKFLKPATIVIPYKESGLKDSQTPSDIDLEYWFKETYGKQMIDFTFNKEAHTLSAKMMEF